MDYLYWLGATIGVESLVLLCWWLGQRTVSRRHVGLDRPDLVSVLGAGVGINVVTHPLAFLFFAGTDTPLVWVELIVLVVEAVGYAWLLAVRWPTAGLLSLLTNGTTALIGFVFAWFHAPQL
jgi:hypothetical protein